MQAVRKEQTFLGEPPQYDDVFQLGLYFLLSELGVL